MREQVISIDYGTGSYTLVLPSALERLTRPKLSKVFSLLCQNLWRAPGNYKTAKILDEYLKDWAEECKAEWDDTSIQFQREFKDPAYNGRTEEEKQAIKRANTQRYAMVKKTKAAYERAKKILESWEEMQQRYET